MDLLYVKCEKDALSLSYMLRERDYDAVFFDNFGEDDGLKTCLSSVQRGDTIHVERGSFLADSFLEGAALFCALSSLGVNIWIDSSQSLISWDDSPFASENLNCAFALVDLRNDYAKERQKEGYQRLKEEGRKLRRQRPLPANFHFYRKAWKAREVTCAKAAQMCGMPTSTFWLRVKQYEAEHQES
ncbi:MAG: recombinase family protein [Desulfovibrio sp.]|nr:recombinase family protein [Desulfovibrio sp.]